MDFRFTLSHSVLGSLQISQPDGWKDAILKLDRHDEYYSLIEYFEGDFIFYGDNGTENGGYHFIKEFDDTYGVNGVLNITIEVSLDDINYTTVFVGQLDVSEAEEMPYNRIQVPIIRDDFWAKFIARRDTPVDIQKGVNLDGDGASSVSESSLILPSQVIRYNGEYIGKQTIAYEMTSGYLSMMYDWDETIIDDLKKFTLPRVETDFANGSGLQDYTLVPGIIEAPYDGVYTFDVRIEGSAYNSSSNSWDSYSGTFMIGRWKEPDTWTDFTITFDAIGSDTIKIQSFSGSFTLKKGDQIVIVARRSLPNSHRINIFGYDLSDTSVNDLGSRAYPGSGTPDTHLYITADTVFKDTASDCMLVHDVGASIISHYGLRSIGLGSTLHAFYSDYFGGPLVNARSYVSAGCGQPFALSKGVHIKGYTILEKAFFISFNDWWSGVNPVFNLGLGYEDDPGDSTKQIIRVEEKSHFFEDSSTSIDFSFVPPPQRVYDSEHHFNKIETGFRKWESESISGIDDPQTKHTYATLFKRVGKAITLFSNFIAASLAWETTRRKSDDKTKDWKFDNDVFIISVNDTELSPEAFEPELDENFSSITNLLNSDTRYNSRLTPGRSFLRWRPFFNGCLQKYTSSDYTFQGGEGNYDMSSNLSEATCDGAIETGNFSEKQDIDVTTEVLFIPELYTVTIPMEWEEYEVIRENRKKPIGISQTSTDHHPFYIKTLEYKVVSGEATMQLWPKETGFEIQVVDPELTNQGCG